MKTHRGTQAITAAFTHRTAGNQSAIERQLSAAMKRADTYWRLLTPEQQGELKGAGLRIEGVAVERSGRMAHVTLSNGSDKTLLNVEVSIIFWDKDAMAYVQHEVIPSVPPRTLKKQYDFPITREDISNRPIDREKSAVNQHRSTCTRTLLGSTRSMRIPVITIAPPAINRAADASPAILPSIPMPEPAAPASAPSTEYVITRPAL